MFFAILLCEVPISKEMEESGICRNLSYQNDSQERKHMKYQLAFIGYGEAGYHISLGLHAEGLNNIVAYDVMQDSPERGEFIQSRAREAGVFLAPSAEEAYSSADFIISMTSPAFCVDVARSVIPHLTAGQTYCDLNSADPVDMAEVNQIPHSEGVNFVDAGVLGSVPKNKHRTMMYLTGSGAQAFYNTFTPYNMRLKVLDAPAGGASAIKLFKSVLNKGLPQLFIETYTSAAAYGVLDELVNLTKDTFKGYNLEEFCDEFLYHTLVHAKRRAAEVGGCARTIERMGLDASMCHATQDKLEMLAKYDYANRIEPDSAPKLREVIAMVLKDTQKKVGDDK